MARQYEDTQNWLSRNPPTDTDKVAIDHFFEKLKNKKEEKKMAGIFEVHVKNGDYGHNPETGNYGTIDFSLKTDELHLALAEFLQWVESINLDEENNKVTLTYRYKVKK